MIAIKKNTCIMLTVLVSIIITLYFITNNRTDLTTAPNLSLKNEIIVPKYKDEFNKGDKVKACFVVLIRNKELKDFIGTMKQLENRFNKEYNYPYVFLNDVDFTDEFKKEVTALTNSTVEFGLIPKEHWSIPDFIDKDKAKKSWEKLESEGIPYGGSESYRHMCRFESGFFFRHELTLKYDYYWRVEPGVDFLCNVKFDPFKYMRDNNKMYGFTIATVEFSETIPTLWNTVKSWVVGNSINLSKDNAREFISYDQGLGYNGCHFWTNFEIASFSLWRDPQYLSFFDYLDKSGGFFYERWGDAPVHSIYASLALNQSQIHFFNEIGYNHPPNMHCPVQERFRSLCDCEPKNNFDTSIYSCAPRWFQLNNIKLEEL